MASIFVKRLMGESTTTGDIAPVEVGAPMLSNPDATAAKRNIPTSKADKDKTRKMRNRVVDGLMGRLKEDRDGAVIPSDAKEVQTIEQSDHGLNLDTPKIPGQKIRNPYSGEEPLILPAASLVAPDVTPEGIFPLDPSQVPGADKGHAPVAPPMGQPAPAAVTPGAGAGSPTIDMMLGKTNSPAAAGVAGPASPAASTADRMTTESALSHLPGIPSPSAHVAASTGVTGDALLSANQPMPDHQGTSIASTMETFSRFVPRGSMRLQE